MCDRLFYHIQNLAKEYVGNWKKFQSFHWYESDRPEDCDNWCIIHTKSRDSGLIDESNAHVISEALAPFLGKEDSDVHEMHCGHWLVGWVDGYAIRVYRREAPQLHEHKQGTLDVTEAFKVYAELKLSLDEYPLLNDSDYSDREYKATIQNIENIGSKFVKSELNDQCEIDLDYWASKVFGWLWENRQNELDDLDDQGGSPSEDAIKDALKALDMLEAEEE